MYIYILLRPHITRDQCSLEKSYNVLSSLSARLIGVRRSQQIRLSMSTADKLGRTTCAISGAYSEIEIRGKGVGQLEREAC